MTRLLEWLADYEEVEDLLWDYEEEEDLIWEYGDDGPQISNQCIDSRRKFVRVIENLRESCIVFIVLVVIVLVVINFRSIVNVELGGVMRIEGKRDVRYNFLIKTRFRELFFPHM